MDLNHDIVVIGASFGGVAAVSTVLGALPADLPAAIFVVIHQPADRVSQLAEIFGEATNLIVGQPLHGERIERGHVYIASPDNHLLVRRGFVEVSRGPRENNHRPAVDALFRTAASSYGSRVLGVVLTGHLDCGTAGLTSIKGRGGAAIVQEPATAAAQGMPASAIAHVTVDEVVPLAGIAAAIVRHVHTPAVEVGGAPPPAVLQLEGQRSRPEVAAVVCPTCSGSLTESAAGDFRYFRCHVGHAFSMEALAIEQAEATERALWAAMRALQESGALANRLAERAPGQLKARYEEKAAAQFIHADHIRSILLSDKNLHIADGLALEPDAGASPQSQKTSD